MKPESLKNTPDPRSDDPRACLSALADGDTQASDAACKLWRDDPEMRKTWHAYQLIGDVMRSEELARAAPRDAAFLAGVRERLAAEPVVLAPMPVVATAPRRQAWLLPVAAAAGRHAQGALRLSGEGPRSCRPALRMKRQARRAIRRRRPAAAHLRQRPRPRPEAAPAGGGT